MKLIIPGVEWWPQKTAAQQIARVGRICYKSKGKQPVFNHSKKKKKRRIMVTFGVIISAGLSKTVKA